MINKVTEVLVKVVKVLIILFKPINKMLAPVWAWTDENWYRKDRVDSKIEEPKK